MFSIEDVKTEVYENNEEFNTFPDEDISNIKCEFQEEETKIQWGFLENQLPTEKYSTNIKTLQIIDGELSASSQKTEHKLSNNKSHVCEICQQVYKTKWHLNIHKTIHTGKQLYKCDTCGKCFNYKENLKRHMKIHTGEKTFKCWICGQYFREKYQLSKHIMIHTGERPYKCETCGLCFSQKT